MGLTYETRKLANGPNKGDDNMNTTHSGSSTAVQFPTLALTQSKIYSETLITGMQSVPSADDL